MDGRLDGCLVVFLSSCRCGTRACENKLLLLPRTFVFFDFSSRTRVFSSSSSVHLVLFYFRSLRGFLGFICLFTRLPSPKVYEQALQERELSSLSRHYWRRQGVESSPSPRADRADPMQDR